MAFEGVVGGATARGGGVSRKCTSSWPVACVRRPTNATSFVAVEGLGWLPVATPRHGDDRGAVDEEVFVGEIMREETREMFVRLRVKASAEAGRLAAEEHVRWMRSETRAGGARETRTPIGTSNTGRRRGEEASTARGGECPRRDVRQDCRKTPKSAKKSRRGGRRSSDKSSSISSPDATPPSPSQLPQPSFNRRSFDHDSAREDEFPPLPESKPPVPSFWSKPPFESSPSSPSPNPSPPMPPMPPPLPPKRWLSPNAPKNFGKKRRFVRRRLERLEKSRAEITSFVTANQESLEKRCENATTELKVLLSFGQRIRFDFDVTIDVTTVTMDRISECPESPLFEKCACAKAHAHEAKGVFGFEKYDFMTDSCDCDACLRAYVRALYTRRCVCPSCFLKDAARRHGTSDTVKQLFSDAEEDSLDIIELESEKSNQPDRRDEDSWGDVLKFISDLDSERTVRHIQCLLERLTKPTLFLDASEKQMEQATKAANDKDTA